MYPLEITAYSDVPSEGYSEFETTSRYVGDIQVMILAKDKFKSVLTDSGVLFNVTLNYIEFGKNPSPSRITGVD